MFSKVNRDILKCWWVWIALLSFLVYFPAINNFFGWDDFLWLYRAKTFLSNPSQIFASEGLYFDPLVYLSFWFNFKLFGLDYRWYHITDITLHAINSLLLYHFVKLYSDDRKLALLSGLIFASTFAASDAVLWSSSRVDLLATLFSLITIILFLKYLKEHKTAFYISSIAAYVLALCAKGTPIVGPALLLWFFIKERKDVKKQYRVFIPFAAIAIGYFILLWIAMDADNPLFKGVFKPNIYNYSLSVAALFIPEIILSRLNLTFIFFLICSILFIFWLMKFSPEVDRVKSTGLFIMLLFLAPVVTVGDFVMVSPNRTIMYYVIGSPSHRIYLATIGMAVFLSCIITGLAKITGIKRFVPFFVLLLLGFNIYEVRQREILWDSGASEVKNTVLQLKKLKTELPEHSEILFINFPLPSGFFEPFIKVYYNLNDVQVVAVLWAKGTEFPKPIHYDINLSGNYFVFARDRNGKVLDISTEWWNL